MQSHIVVGAQAGAHAAMAMRRAGFPGNIVLVGADRAVSAAMRLIRDGQKVGPEALSDPAFNLRKLLAPAASKVPVS